jgi:hypothetical protein
MRQDALLFLDWDKTLLDFYFFLLHRNIFSHGMVKRRLQNVLPGIKGSSHVLAILARATLFNVIQIVMLAHFLDAILPVTKDNLFLGMRIEKGLDDGPKGAKRHWRVTNICLCGIIERVLP